MKYWLIKANKTVLWIIVGIGIPTQVYATTIRIVDPQNGDIVSRMLEIKGKIIPNDSNKNMSYGEVNAMVEKNGDVLAALFENQDVLQATDMIKCLIYQESGWRQYDAKGHVLTNRNEDRENSNDYGLCQINNIKSTLNQKTWDIDKIKNDEEYNFTALIQVMKNKKDMLNKLRRNKQSWDRWEQKAKLKGHAEWEILIKSYNGLVPNWGYVNSIKDIAVKKPWEARISVQCYIDELLINQQTIRLIDEYQYVWDSTSVPDGLHQVKAQIVKKSQDQVRIQVANENQKEDASPQSKLGAVEGILETENVLLKGGRSDVLHLIIKYRIIFKTIKFYQYRVEPAAAGGANRNSVENKIPVEEVQNNIARYNEGKQQHNNYDIGGKVLAELVVQKGTADTGKTRYLPSYAVECEIIGSLKDKAVMQENMESIRQMQDLLKKFDGSISKPADPFEQKDPAYNLYLEMPLRGREDDKDLITYVKRSGQMYSGNGKTMELEMENEEEAYASIRTIFRDLRFIGRYNSAQKTIELTADENYVVKIGDSTNKTTLKGAGTILLEKE